SAIPISVLTRKAYLLIFYPFLNQPSPISFFESFSLNISVIHRNAKNFESISRYYPKTHPIIPRWVYALTFLRSVLGIKAEIVF
ncbi:MAG: hypothetical protein L6371_08550, partial [Candidatus Atribacteria bacterium]|nr:hypothetical protein [Candidatus Atribacteria bacterium]